PSSVMTGLAPPRPSDRPQLPNLRGLQGTSPPASPGGPGKIPVSAWFSAVGEVLAELLGQRSEGISLPGSPWRAGAPARAAALSDWLFCLGLPRRWAMGGVRGRRR